MSVSISSAILGPFKFIVPGVGEKFLEEATKNGNSKAVEIAQNILKSRQQIYLGLTGAIGSIFVIALGFICKDVGTEESFLDTPFERGVKSVQRNVGKIVIGAGAIGAMYGTGVYIGASNRFCQSVIKKWYQGF